LFIALSIVIYACGSEKLSLELHVKIAIEFCNDDYKEIQVVKMYAFSLVWLICTAASVVNHNVHIQILYHRFSTFHHLKLMLIIVATT